MDAGGRPPVELAEREADEFGNPQPASKSQM
jgi:hypothetical protein